MLCNLNLCDHLNSHFNFWVAAETAIEESNAVNCHRHADSPSQWEVVMPVFFWNLYDGCVATTKNRDGH